MKRYSGKVKIEDLKSCPFCGFQPTHIGCWVDSNDLFTSATEAWFEKDEVECLLCGYHLDVDTWQKRAKKEDK